MAFGNCSVAPKRLDKQSIKAPQHVRVDRKAKSCNFPGTRQELPDSDHSLALNMRAALPRLSVAGTAAPIAPTLEQESKAVTRPLFSSWCPVCLTALQGSVTQHERDDGNAGGKRNCALLTIVCSAENRRSSIPTPELKLWSALDGVCGTVFHTFQAKRRDTNAFRSGRLSVYGAERAVIGEVGTVKPEMLKGAARAPRGLLWPACSRTSRHAETCPAHYCASVPT
jgi:hypothetical protein